MTAAVQLRFAADAAFADARSVQLKPDTLGRRERSHLGLGRTEALPIASRARLYNRDGVELKLIELVLPVVTGAAAGAWATWVTEPRRRQAAVDSAVLAHRLEEHRRQQEADQRVAAMREEHRLALQAKEREVLQDAAAVYAKDLRDQRATAYRELWKRLEILALFQPQADVTYAKLEQLSVDLREWYFTIGGLLLSTEARNAYFAVQDCIVEVLRGAQLNGTSKTPLRSVAETFTTKESALREEELSGYRPGTDPKCDYFRIRGYSSTLRSKLCDDLGSRAQPLVRQA